MTIKDLPSVRSSEHPLDLSAAARDLWPGGTLRFWLGEEAPRPARVYWPEDETQVLDVLRAASNAGVPVVPYGAGSGVCGGARGKSGSVTLDLKAMDRIGPIDTERWTVDAEAGVNGQHLEDWLNERGWTVGHSPSSIWCSTVGGWAAARGAGQFSSRYGVFEDMVLQLRVVAPGCGVVVVGEDGDAPDEWMPMILGSEGTLGVITRVRMRIWPLPEKRWLRGYRFPDVHSTVRAMRRLMQEELWPSVLRLYDPVDTKIGGKTKPKSEKMKEGTPFYQECLRWVEQIPAVRRNLLVLPLALPGLVNHVFDQIASGCLLIAGWEGDGEVVGVQSSAGHRVLCEEGEDLGEAPGQRWFHSRHGVSYKLMPIFERGGFADTMEVACRWSQLVPLYNAVRGAVTHNVVIMAHMSHLYPEGGSIYFSFAGRGDKSVYEHTWKNAQEAVLSVGATVTHHHGVGSLKSAYASAEVGPAVAGWRELKAELDPRGVMNPGRLFVDVPPRDPGSLPGLSVEDGLVRVSVDATWVERQAACAPGEVRWPYEELAGPPRWQRVPWATGWTEVDGRVGDVPCRLGRGPRSAAGPDLRKWLVERSDRPVTATIPSIEDGPRWMGVGTPSEPWRVAMELLRSDLRPSVLTVEGDRLLVGFRGIAAADYGALAAGRVPGGLEEVAYRPVPLPSGSLVPCDVADPAVVMVTLSGAFKRNEGAS